MNVLFIMYIVYCTVFCSRSALTIISQFIYPPKQPPAQEPHRLRNSGMDIPGLKFKDITGQTYFLSGTYKLVSGITDSYMSADDND